jgi:hypothetical protein
MPYPLSRSVLRWVISRERRPVIFYFHPWELDDEQPRVTAASAKTRFRHYVNLRHMRGRIRRLLREFRWGRMDEIFLPEAM